MNEAKALLDAGQLTKAIEAATREVKAHPADVAGRTFLFELLLFAGDWERALKQLDVVAGQNAQSELGAQVYRNNIEAMRQRERLWSESLAPHFLSEPPAEVDMHLAAIKEWSAGRVPEAQALLDAAAEQRVPQAGRNDGLEFDDWRDADDLLAPVLELIIADKYAWLPFAHIKQIEFAPPRQLRDLVWCPVRVQTRQGTIGEMFAPALYEGSQKHADDLVRLGRMTDWQGDDEGPARAVGLRLFMADDEEKTIFETRRLEFS
ncbi:MAG TPA: type VI secretion system accessory protein TagJ [Pyrinomonadaceae bacterium]|nr:type VI secretion system accessory protein TagJ [Pyrinomonadaceae bacterium]